MFLPRSQGTSYCLTFHEAVAWHRTSPRVRLCVRRSAGPRLDRGSAPYKRRLQALPAPTGIVEGPAFDVEFNPSPASTPAAPSPRSLPLGPLRRLLLRHELRVVAAVEEDHAVEFIALH